MNHHIQQLTIEFDAPDFPAAREKQQALTRWAKSDLLWKAANEVLDAYDVPGHVLRIPRLELEVNIENEAMFQTAFLASLGKNLELAISKIQEKDLVEKQKNPDSSNNRVLTSAENAFQAMILYLKNGVLPWYLSRHEYPYFNAFIRDFNINGTADQIQFLRQEAMTNTIICKRLYDVLGPVGFYNLVIRNLTQLPLRSDWTAQFWRDLLANKSLDDEKYLFLKTIFLQIEKINAANWPEFKEETRSLMQTNATELPRIPDLPEKSLFISNAGIVLLAPYFEQLFKATGLIRQRHFCSQAAQERAILLLHYLTEGETAAWEYNFPVFKILCGYPLNMPIQTSLQLSTGEKQICDELLQFAISQWTIMRNASPTGLRDTFLKRPGKLWQKEDASWCLLVEKKTEDVLLERLPSGWSFSILKFPWMPQILYVEW